MKFALTEACLQRKNKKLLKEEKLEINFNDRDAIEIALDDAGISATPEDVCYQLTAYEKAGLINFDTGIVDVLLDLSDEEPDVSEYMDYLREERPDDEVFSNDDFDEIFSGDDPWNIACRVHFGDFNPGRDYFRFNGYGNVESIDEYDLEKEMEDDDDFRKWYVNEHFSDVVDDEDIKKDLINGTLQLVKQGY